MKAVVVDDNGYVVADASSPLTCHSPIEGWSEQQPSDWIVAVEHASRNLRSKLGERWERISAIGLSGQMHGAVLLDKHKEPIRPAILWNDSRSAPQCEQLNQGFSDIEELAGICAMPGFTAPKVLWCQQHEPESYAQIAHILLPKDYVKLWLTGELSIDMSDAAGTLWLDQARRTWHESLCDASATKMQWLPELMEGTAGAGSLRKSVANRLGLPTGIPIAAGGGDAATGAVGIGAINDGDAFVSLGTSGQLFVATDSYRSAPGTAIHCYAHCVPDRWFQMAAMLNGASPMAWFSKAIGSPIETLLHEAQGASSAPMFLPYLTGERTPHNDADIQGGFYGLTPSTDRGDMMRAIVNSIAWTFLDAMECLQSAGTEIDRVAVIGGGARSDFLLQTMADAMGITFERLIGAETGPALGAARLAMVTSGAHALDDVASRPGLDRVFKPDPEQAGFHRAQHRRWRAFYQAVKPISIL